MRLEIDIEERLELLSLTVSEIDHQRIRLEDIKQELSYKDILSVDDKTHLDYIQMRIDRLEGIKAKLLSTRDSE